LTIHRPADSLRDLVQALVTKKHITAEDVAKIGHAFQNADHQTSEDEVFLLFDIDELIKDKDPSWHSLFTNSVTDFVLFIDKTPARTPPTQTAISILERRQQGGCDTELRLLVTLLSRLQTVSLDFKHHLLYLLKKNLLEGERNIYGTADREGKGRLQEEDVALLDFIMYGTNTGAPVRITRHEATFLFELDRLTEGREHCASWAPFFQKAVTNYLLQGNYDQSVLSETEKSWLAMQLKAQPALTPAQETLAAHLETLQGGEAHPE
jgi:hypothetical protein